MKFAHKHTEYCEILTKNYFFCASFLICSQRETFFWCFSKNMRTFAKYYT